MKTCLQITLLLALVMATAVSAAQVTSINVVHETGGTVVRIDLQGPFQFTHMTEVPKDGKPDRLIVDIVGATHTWGPKEWGSLPPCGVAKLRIGQYSSKPEKVVRVVLELAKAPVYQADSDGKSITLRLTDSSAKPFAAWTTGPAPLSAPIVPAAAPSTPAVASTQPASKPAASTTTSATASAPKPTAPTVAAAPKTESKPADKPASHTTLAQQPASTTPASKPTVTASAPKSTTPASTPTITVTASKPAAATTPTTIPAPAVASNDTKATPPSAPAVKPATAPKTESAPAPAVATQTTKPSTATVPSQTVPAPTPTVATQTTKPSTVIAPAQTAPKPQPTQTVPAATPAADAKLSTPTVAQSAPASKPALSEVKAPVVPANNPVAKPDQLAKVDQFKPRPAPAQLTEKSAQPSTPTAKPSTPTVAVTTPAAPSTPADKPVETKEAASAKSDDKDVSVKAPEKPLLAEADDAAGSSTPARQTARFRRSATASAKMKSSLVAEFPQRLVIKYENLGYRDPFATLIDDSRTYDTPIEKRLANVEGLRLVGILESGIGDNRALFQDKRNFSYMLKSGDKVEKGYVLRVESDKVYFQIFEYGWSRTVALTFDNRN